MINTDSIYDHSCTGCDFLKMEITKDFFLLLMKKLSILQMEKSDVLFRPKLPVIAERLLEKDIGGLKQMFKMIDADNNGTIKVIRPQKSVDLSTVRRSSRVTDKPPQASGRPRPASAEDDQDAKEAFTIMRNWLHNRQQICKTVYPTCAVSPQSVGKL
ncbi:hypothetical protein Tco_0839927 [Tanacetum coccineum]|uniref:EF-hand domain-containing protein n=1 Tax=Tanacetum coccineum TaxID=301880 RepID=A0ABQ5AS08_9ASTR